MLEREIEQDWRMTDLLDATEEDSMYGKRKKEL